MKKLVLFLIVLMICILSGCVSKDESYISKTDLVMGTIVDLHVYGYDDKNILNKAFDRLKDIEKMMSINIGSSEISSINKHSGQKPIIVSKDTFYVVYKSLYYAKLSNGKFDPTIGPLVQLWNIGNENAKIPSQCDISKVLSLINYNDVVLDKEKNSIFLKEKNMSLDLGGIAKGYAADEIRKIFEENGITSAVINIGGNIVTIGNNPDGRPWNIGVQDPNEDTGSYMGILQVKDASVVTSGIYERYIKSNEKIYHHIFDTTTGYPVDNEILSVTIINENSIDGDALSTVIFLSGVYDGLSLIESIENTECIIVTKDNEVYLSSGIKDSFKITDDKYVIKQNNIINSSY
ncbi:thiamine biosynthesis lipoprotein [Alkalithermobacter thermoalcaliphilus JW-YL-7 = DSM 7308]|uniref:FAD:protein FMN transferase n=1 Tax=Alkalithermobacter thermoalcaliphilus JW-YL-7 = DSM 7308 TaxID=1121328 RepID=A0A150FRJ5_CLOPD|nr:ApbE family lipoprotein [[Clostridium] paradoxum JW-YL-7 = DSM 7308]SHK80925.1 thiamine biosynthesis lipoprotein [[Clostridium] paradoxum JW-YL-7 = DSM 7308]